VPFTLRNLKEDLEDIGSSFDGAPDLEFPLLEAAARAGPSRPIERDLGRLLLR
jgi:hypothetical protein